MKGFSRMSNKERLTELASCPVCLDLMEDPRMLPCQHTFCLNCVQKLVKEPSMKVRCAQCRARYLLPKGGVQSLPSNLCIQSVLDMLGLDEKQNPTCHVCDTSCDVRTCKHCLRVFCAICEQRHLLHLEQQLREIMDQLLLTKAKTLRKVKSFEELCDQVKESVHMEVQNRVKLVLEMESNLVNQIDEIRSKGKMRAAEVVSDLDEHSERILELLNGDFEPSSPKTASEKVSLFLEMHRETSAILEDSESTQLGSLMFSPDTLTISSPGQLDTFCQSQEKASREDGKIPNKNTEDSISQQHSSLETGGGSENAHSLLYRTRPFLSKVRLGTAFLQRPSGVAVSPWSNEIYVVSMDTHRVYVFDTERKKFLRSFGSRGQNPGEFMCPYGIALSSATQEIYITDKWKHCIHVFDRGETFSKQIGCKGSGKLQFRSPESICVDNDGRIFVCDTINNRIQVLNKDGSFLKDIDGQVCQQGDTTGQKRRVFNEPSGVAVTADGKRLIVSDFSNHRIHVFNGHDGGHLLTCGQKGPQRGQFNNPECVAVDCRGFIFVGDSGNCRVQILRPDGRFVRTFGSKGSLPGHFNWISGIAVTQNRDVIVCDFKNHCVQVF